MTLLSKTAILTANDLQTEDIEVPEWGGAVRVRSFTGRERDAFESSMVRGDGRDRKVDLTNMRARLGCLTGIDECHPPRLGAFLMHLHAVVGHVYRHIRHM